MGIQIILVHNGIRIMLMVGRKFDMKKKSEVIETTKTSVSARARSFGSYRLSRRAVFVLGFCLFAIGSGFYGYFLYNSHRDKQLADEGSRRIEASEMITGTYLEGKGDRDLSVEYLAQINAGNYDNAVRLFTDIADASESSESKAGVYHQLYRVALFSKSYDHALLAAKQLSELQPGFESYYSVANVYEMLGDSTGRVEYLKKAQSSLDPSKPDEAELRTTIEQSIQESSGGN